MLPFTQGCGGKGTERARDAGVRGSLGQSSPCPAIPWGATLPPSICVLLTASLPASVPWPLAVCIARGCVFPSRESLGPCPLGPGRTDLHFAFRPRLVVSSASLRHSKNCPQCTSVFPLTYAAGSQEVGDPGRLGRGLLVWAVGSDSWGWLMINPKT